MDRRMAYNMTFLEADLVVFAICGWKASIVLNRESFCAFRMLQLNHSIKIQCVLPFKCSCGIYKQICSLDRNRFVVRRKVRSNYECAFAFILLISKLLRPQLHLEIWT